MPSLFAKIPKHNEKYTDERCDYRRRILEYKISNLTKQYASYLIKQINQGNVEETEKFIFGLEGINN